MSTPDVRVVREACLYELEDGHPIFGAVDEDDVYWSVVDGHPVDPD